MHETGDQPTEHEKRGQIPELKSLTTFRFAAALWVLLHDVFPRLAPAGFASLPSPARAFLLGGYTAVPFFFVLSGFALSYSYQARGPEALKGFFFQRVKRLAPAFYLSLAIGAPAFWLSLSAPNVAGRFAAFLSVNLFFLQTFAADSLGFNLPAWSLTAQVFFYLTFPLVFPFVRRLERRGALAFLLACFALDAALQITAYVIVASRGGTPWETDLAFVNPAVAAFLLRNPFSHWLEFGFGLALGRLHSFSARRRGDFPLALGAALLLPILFTTAIPKTCLGSFALLPAFALLLFGGAGERGPLSRWLEARWLVALGHASYALYILHQPLLNLLVLLGGSSPMGAPAWLLVGGFCAGMCLLALAVHRYFEQPIRRRLLQ